MHSLAILVYLSSCCYFLLLIDVVRSIHLSSSSSSSSRFQNAMKRQRIIPVLHNLLPDTAIQYASIFHRANIVFTTSIRHKHALETVNKLSGINRDEKRLVNGNNNHNFTFGVSTMHDVSQVSFINIIIYIYTYVIIIELSNMISITST